MLTEFFVAMNPPTTTAQMHKITRKGQFYDPPELKAAKAKLEAHLAGHVPEKRYTGPIALSVMWCFDSHGRHPDGEWKTTRPDTDNLQKALKDIMTKLGFWTDDALVVREVIEKRWANVPGLLIRIEAVGDER
jgi:Holliday junction resolvase RusA-like endonuclease